MTAQKLEPERPRPQRQAKKLGRPPSDAPTFPRDTLNESLQVARAIRRDGSGDPMNPILLANSLKTTRRSKKYDELLRSSERYGLTNGTIYSKSISLTDLGKALVIPTDEETLGSSLRRALLSPELFGEFFANTDKKPIQKEAYFKNTLETKYNVRRVDVDICYGILVKNIRDQDLILKQGQEELLWLDNLGKTSPTNVATDIETSETSAEETERTSPEGKPIFEAPPTKEEVVKVPRVFISHSKNKKILDNVKQMLTFGNFDSRVAEEKETLSMPLSDKVFGLMKECNCAIINVSADQEKKQGDTYGINENVLIEIGASFLHYDKRVLLVIDQRFKDKLPTILQGITAIFYEGQELSLTDGMKLMKSLGEFRNKL